MLASLSALLTSFEFVEVFVPSASIGANESNILFNIFM